MFCSDHEILHNTFHVGTDENGSDMNGYHRYHICFYISGRIRIRIRIMSTILDKIGLDVDIINIRFKYSDTDTVSDVDYSDSNTDRSEPPKRIWSRIWSQNICTVFIPACRHTKKYLQGVNGFLAFAFRNSAVGDKILCPCRKCI